MLLAKSATPEAMTARVVVLAMSRLENNEYSAMFWTRVWTSCAMYVGKADKEVESTNCQYHLASSHLAHDIRISKARVLVHVELGLFEAPHDRKVLLVKSVVPHILFDPRMTSRVKLAMMGCIE